MFLGTNMQNGLQSPVLRALKLVCAFKLHKELFLVLNEVLKNVLWLQFSRTRQYLSTRFGRHIQG